MARLLTPRQRLLLAADIALSLALLAVARHIQLGGTR